MITSEHNNKIIFPQIQQDNYNNISLKLDKVITTIMRKKSTVRNSLGEQKLQELKLVNWKLRLNKIFTQQSSR